MHRDFTFFVKSIVTSCFLFGLCTLGPAPLMGQKLGIKQHTNLKSNDEKTLESEQVPVFKQQVGNAPLEHRDQEIAVQSTAQDGENVLAAGSRRVGSANGSDEANQVLRAANARLEPQQNHMWIWIILTLACVGGGVFSLKRWADNNIPNAPTVTPKRQGW